MFSKKPAPAKAGVYAVLRFEHATKQRLEKRGCESFKSERALGGLDLLDHQKNVSAIAAITPDTIATAVVPRAVA